MKRHIKVSIITVCFNCENTIRDTIKNVLYQSYKNIEYIIIDGKSSDSTIEIIKEYIPLFKGRLRYISEEDNGIYDAMNKGIRLSTGDLIGIINGDDFYETDAVENIIEHIDLAKYQVLYGYCNVIYKGQVVKVMKTHHKRLTKDMIPHPTCFVTRQTYQNFGLFLTGFKIASDYELMLRFYKSKQVTFIQIPKIIANFRKGGVSTRSEMEERRLLERAWIWYRFGEISIKELIVCMFRYLLFSKKII
jgi:glycosyltransferase involved in cell wall biosynthesis